MTTWQAAEELQLVGTKPRVADTVASMTARFQPRDADGRFVPYAWLRGALAVGAAATPS